MAKRNKNKWSKWTPCKKCGGRKTYGGIKFWFLKIREWSNDCKCTRYKGQTELDKEKCKEVIKENKEKNND